MTCIVGIAERGIVWIGGDSAGVSGWTLRDRSDPKVFTSHGFIYGFTSSFRMGNLLRYRFTPPDHQGSDLARYMATDYIDAVRACFKDHAFGKVDNNEQSGGTFLVGHRGALFTVCSDFQVGQERSGCAACGSGEASAMGALFATKGMPPDQRVGIALRAAEAVSIGVRGPFVIEKLTRAKAGAKT